jgi:predicted RNA-binding Zn-ribbon protein involved in translation (DUF1610 family)
MNATTGFVTIVVFNGGMNKMICPHCGENVDGEWTDVGIGPYEYWGSKETDTQMVLLCEACDGELESKQTYEQYVRRRKEEFFADRDDD